MVFEKFFNLISSFYLFLFKQAVLLVNARKHVHRHKYPSNRNGNTFEKDDISLDFFKRKSYYR